MSSRTSFSRISCTSTWSGQEDTGLRGLTDNWRLLQLQNAMTEAGARRNEIMRQRTSTKDCRTNAAILFGRASHEPHLDSTNASLRPQKWRQLKQNPQLDFQLCGTVIGSSPILVQIAESGTIQGNNSIESLECETGGMEILKSYREQSASYSTADSLAWRNQPIVCDVGIIVSTAPR